jgi:hypothetical protein
LELKLVVNKDGSVTLVDENAGGREIYFDAASSFADEVTYELESLGWLAPGGST